MKNEHTFGHEYTFGPVSAAQRTFYLYIFFLHTSLPTLWAGTGMGLVSAAYLHPRPSHLIMERLARRSQYAARERRASQHWLSTSGGAVFV